MPVPVNLPPETALFNVPAQLVKILNRDLAAAGIPKKADPNHRAMPISVA